MKFTISVNTGEAPNQGMLMRALEHSLDIMRQKGYLESFEFSQINEREPIRVEDRDFWGGL